MSSLAVMVTASPPAMADTSTTYNSPGTYTYTVPAGTTVLSFVVAGSQGGATSASPGGKGGTVSGTISVSAGAVFTVDVGGYGTGFYTGGPGTSGYSGSGGGASDIRGVAIAGGGGGGGAGGDVEGAGGAGGYPNGGTAASQYPASGGTQTAPGAGGGSGMSCAGFGGAGGAGGAGWIPWSGGGGGGFFGGGGGGCYGSGGGGSSWASANVAAASFGNGTQSGTGSVTLTPNGSPSSDLVSVGSPNASASSFCAQNGGQQIEVNDTEGVATSIYLRQVANPPEVDVCFRVDDGTTGTGGRVAITPTDPTVGLGTLGVPSADNNSTACTTATPNSVPGQHPAETGGIAGVPYMFDAYSDDASQAWVCAQVGSQVSTRVMVPVILPNPSVTTGTDVTFYPDSDALS